MKFDVLVAVPPGVVTEITPVVALAGTVVVIWPARAIKLVWTVPLKLTDVVPAKFVPEMVTEVPTTPRGGEKSTIVGGDGITTKGTWVVTVPSAQVTEINPVVAVPGTVAVTCVVEADGR